MTIGHYTPPAGTLPARALQHLATLQPGAYISTAELAEALGSDCKTVNTSLQTAVRHDAVHTNRVAGIRFWAIGRHPVPQPAIDDGPDGEPEKPIRRPKHVTPKVTATPFVGRLRPEDGIPERISPNPSFRRLACGGLVIDLGGLSVRLDKGGSDSLSVFLASEEYGKAAA